MHGEAGRENGELSKRGVGDEGSEENEEKKRQQVLLALVHGVMRGQASKRPVHASIAQRGRDAEGEKSRKCRRVAKVCLERQRRPFLRQRARRRPSAICLLSLSSPPEPAELSSLNPSQQLMKIEEAAASLRAPFKPVHCFDSLLEDLSAHRKSERTRSR